LVQKHKVAVLGRTKEHRDPNSKTRKKDSGCAPDSLKDLKTVKNSSQCLLNFKTKSRLPVKNSEKMVYSSYSWNQNSCWLDTSLELLYNTTSDNLTDLVVSLSDVPVGTGLKELYVILKNCIQRSSMTSKEMNVAQDGLRELLYQKGIKASW
jgi:hypothetical protein